MSRLAAARRRRWRTPRPAPRPPPGGTLPRSSVGRAGFAAAFPAAGRRASYTASQNGGPADAANAQDVGRGTQANLARGGFLPDAFEALREDVVQLLADPIQPPLVVLVILHPLEVAGRDAAGIGQDIGQDRNSALVKNIVRIRPGRGVGAFNNH